MSKYRGMLLFDIADDPIGKWHENLGTRGYYTLWQIADEKGVPIQSIVIDMDEETDDQWEAEWYDEITGNTEFIEYGYYDDCLKVAKKFMREHPNGFQKGE